MTSHISGRHSARSTVVVGVVLLFMSGVGSGQRRKPEMTAIAVNWQCLIC